MNSETSYTLRDVIADLRRTLTRLEHLSLRDGRTVDQQILDCLGDVGPLTTSAVTRLIRRNRQTVLATLKLMADAGRVVRDDIHRTWRISE